MTRLTTRYHVAFAFDRGVRVKSPDGHLHVGSSIISSATVNDYLGSEIPHYHIYGLKPDRLYPLLRDPIALEKAVPSLHGKPLLLAHRPQTAVDHDRDVVVGSVSNPVWESPNVMAEITVWDQAAIDMIESGDRSDLSAGYAYTPLMTPGTFNGVPFSGSMTNIVFNHLALVDVGRVSNAVVGDSAIQKGAIKMANSEMQKAYETLEKFLQEKLSQEDFHASMEHVGNLCLTCQTGEDDDADDHKVMDDPPDFAGASPAPAAL